MTNSERVFTLVTHVLRRGDGQGRVNLEIVQRALETGWKVVVVSSEIAPEVRDHPSVEWHRVPVEGFPTYLLRNQVFAFRSAALLRRFRRGPLVVNGWITYPASDLNACHFVHSSWMHSPVHPGRLLRGFKAWYQTVFTWLNAKLEIGAYNRAGTVVAVSKQVERELVENGVRSHLVTTIPNGVDGKEFAPGVACRSEFGLPRDVLLALFAGDIRSPRKNLETALRALRSAPGVHLAIAGSTTGSPYPAMAEELGVADRAHFLGMVRRMPELMRSCDVFVFPSRYEACSLVLLEAMASGLAIVAPLTTGGAELVPEDAGRLLDSPEDSEGIARFLRRVDADRAALLDNAKAARRAAEALTWTAMADRYLELLSHRLASKA